MKANVRINGQSNGKAEATDAAWKLADQAGVNLRVVHGSGVGGRVLVKDVEKHLATMQAPKSALYGEIGATFESAYGGLFNQAHVSDLQWPAVYDTFSRIRRTDPEVAVVRQIFTALSKSPTIEFVPGTDEPSDGDKEAVDFCNECLEDMAQPFSDSVQTILSNTPFYGWSWQEAVPGLRSQSWSPPIKEDNWRSKYDDGRIGIRRLGWRDPSTFTSWDLTERYQRLRGMVQDTMLLGRQVIPLDRSVHLTFGDSHSPEGLSPLEALWRLERVKYGLEFIQGVGYERSAGYLEFNIATTPSDEDKAFIRDAARAVMSAQEGNYLLLPENIVAKLINVAYSNGGDILNAIQFYHLLKLQLFSMQWAALSTTSGTGSRAAMTDSSSMFLAYYNSMLGGFMSDLGRQYAGQLMNYNPLAFPGLTALPKLKAAPVSKDMAATAIADFFSTIQSVFPLGPEDEEIIRKRSDGWLSETSSVDQEGYVPPVNPFEDEDEDAEDASEDEDAEDASEDEPAELQLLLRARLEARLRSVDLQAEAIIYEAVRMGYADTVEGLIWVYFNTPGMKYTSLAKLMREEIQSTWLDVFFAGYLEGGLRDLDPADVEWLATRMVEEYGHANNMALSMRELKQSSDDVEDAIALAPMKRAAGYTQTLDWIYTEARLRSNPKLMLTFVGLDGKDSCTTCSKWKNKRHSAKFWLARDLIPAPGNGNFECGCWRCQHYLVSDDGDSYGDYNIEWPEAKADREKTK